MNPNATEQGEAGWSKPADGEDFDVAIVGGGISGIYCAWRLLDIPCDQLGPDLRALAARRDDKRLRVGLFEYGDRIGGRLFSVTLPGVPDRPVELGGMRFLSLHRRVTTLVQRLGLDVRELNVEDPNQRHLFYLRGRHCTGADWARPSFEPAYRLDRAERIRSPSQLMLEAALRHCEEVHKRPKDYRNKGFWNLLLDEYSEEAYQLIRDAGGYHSIVGNWCAADAIPFLLADFSDSRYWALEKGFEELPRQLRRRFEAAGGELRFRHRLHRLDRDGTDALRLVFDHGDPAKFGQGRRIQTLVTCRARHVLLAMPRRAIEMLHPDSFIFQGEPGRQFEDDLRSVLPQPGFKIFAAYRRPWWKTTRGITAGRSVTDLPIRQCYYWATSDESDPELGNLNSILMASYNDGSSVEFWAGLVRRTERYDPPSEAFPPNVDPTSYASGLENLLAPAPLVEELQDQLRELHGLAPGLEPSEAEFLPPYIVVCHDWTQEPFGGGWHFWKIGADSMAIGQRMQKPFADAPLYVCGEAWSHQQGWVEGALETADMVLEKQLGLPPRLTHGRAAKSARSMPRADRTGAAARAQGPSRPAGIRRFDNRTS